MIINSDHVHNIYKYPNSNKHVDVDRSLTLELDLFIILKYLL